MKLTAREQAVMERGTMGLTADEWRRLGDKRRLVVDGTVSVEQAREWWLTDKPHFDSPTPPNIHRAIDTSDGSTVYLVGIYDSGRYVTQMDRHERRLTGGAAWQGKYGCHDRRIYHSEGGARRAAQRLYGYGKITDACGPFGRGYEPLS